MNKIWDSSRTNHELPNICLFSVGFVSPKGLFFGGDDPIRRLRIPGWCEKW